MPAPLPDTQQTTDSDNGMTDMETIGFVIYLAMTITFFGWIAYLKFSK